MIAAPETDPTRSDRADQLASDALPAVRQAVRRILESTPAFLELDPAARREIASSMVQVCRTATNLIAEEVAAEEELQVLASERRAGSHAPAVSRSQGHPETAEARPAATAGDAPIATGLSAGRQFSGVAADRVAGTTRRILNAVSFPRFVTELINGVFTAILDSSQRQLHMYIELLNNVAASTEGFADSQVGGDRARQWLVDRYPDVFAIDSGVDPEFDDPDDPAEARLVLRPGARMPTEAALRTDLGLADEESVPTGDPERILVPLARRQVAKTRQEMLATLVMLGLQRIVIDSGRITAGMRFHIDTRSAAEVDAGSRTELQNQIGAQGRFGLGPWGASASVQNHFAYVSTQDVRTTEEMNTDLELTSSVELNFRSDYLPLNRLAAPGQAARIEANTRNPDFEAARREEEQRRAAQRTGDEARRTAVRSALTPTQFTPLNLPELPASQQPSRGGGQAGGGQTGGGQASGGQAGGAAAGGGQGGGAQGGGGQGGGAQGGGGGGATTPAAAPSQGGTPAPDQPATAAQPRPGESGAAPQAATPRQVP